MAVKFPGDFARLLPANQLAKRLFSRCYIYAQEYDAFHLNFMVPLPGEQPVADDEPFESSTDYNSQYSDDVDESLQNGCFILSLEQNRWPKFPLVGWRFGRGSAKAPNRGVDILLAKPGEIASKSLASYHFLLRISEHSGLLMLRHGTTKKGNPRLETNTGGNWESLAPEQEMLVYQKSTLLRVGRCEFDLQYTIGEDDRDPFLTLRNTFVDTKLNPPTNIHEYSTYIPGESITVRGRYLQLATRGHGTFGWISQGLDTRTGQLIAIKELRIEKQRDWLLIKDEIEMGRRFQTEEGLLSLHDFHCEHGKVDSCSVPEKYYFTLPYAISDLSTGFWAKPDKSHAEKLPLLEGPLRGLDAMHGMHIMHRDLRPQNMLLLSEKPPRAAICDYGKVIEAEFSKDTRIGPIHTLAPEVWDAEGSGYTRSIDVWAFGYAMADILGYRAAAPWPRITPRRHGEILGKLRTHAERVPEDEAVADLATRMLAWDPSQRLTAAEALQHRCWTPIRNAVTGA